MWIGNHAAPDLCNTEPVIDGRPVDLLPDFGAVVRWATLAGIGSPDENSSVSANEAARTVRFVRRLRGALRGVLDPTAGDDGALIALNDVLRDERGAFHVDLSPNVIPVTLRTATGAPQLRLDIASAVLDIFRHHRRLVRRCAHPACVLLFLDRSKSGVRRWCEMTTCGNRAKVAAHYARSRGL